MSQYVTSSFDLPRNSGNSVLDVNATFASPLWKILGNKWNFESKKLCKSCYISVAVRNFQERCVIRFPFFSPGIQLFFFVSTLIPALEVMVFSGEGMG